MQDIDGKVVVLGSQGVGKTSIIAKYVGNTLKHPTIGAGFFSCKLNLKDATIKLQVWDTAGQERFKSMAPMYYRNANVAMLVFDLTNYNTFVAVKSWVNELKRNIERQMVLIVIGNKSDLIKDREVDTEEARTYATKIGAIYRETSVLHNEGIDSVFLAIANGLLQMSSDNQEITTCLKLSDSTCSELSNPMPLTPYEESSCNTSIALGIHEKPHTCC